MNQQVTTYAPLAPDSVRAALLPTSFQQVMDLANVMSRSGAAVPKHLQSNAGACFAVITSAIRWGMDPFAVARKTYFVNNVMAYESGLVAAVIYSSGVLKERFSVAFSGEGALRRCTVVGTFKSGEVREYRSPEIKDISPKNSPLWKVDPDRQLMYWAQRAWANQWAPDVVLGVYCVDDIDDQQTAVVGTSDAPIVIDARDPFGDAPETEGDPIELFKQQLDAAEDVDTARAVIARWTPRLKGQSDEVRAELRTLAQSSLDRFKTPAPATEKADERTDEAAASVDVGG